MSNSDALLPDMLAVAVPWWIAELHPYTAEKRHRIGREDGAFIASHGDDILYRGHKKGKSAAAFNALARGLAAAAFQPGGVRFAGLRWCAAHLNLPWTEADGYPCPHCLREEAERAA